MNASLLVKKVEVLSTPLLKGLVVRKIMGPIESIRLSPVKLEISLPIKNQKTSIFESSLFGEQADTTTDFGIIYNASIYVIFRKADLSKLVHLGAPDVRDVLVDVIGKEKAWKTKRIPPNPLRQDIYLVYLKDNSNTKEFIGKIFREENRLYYYLNEKMLSCFYNFEA